MYDSDKRKLLSALAHGSIFLSAAVISIAVPIGVLFVSDDPVVKENAREAINFHFNVWVYEAILGFIWFTIIGIPLLVILVPAFFIFHWGLPILAIFQSFGRPDQPYRYPFIFRLM